MTPDCHLAQVNIARARAPIDGPVMAGFVALLAEINALAERSPGFVWRLRRLEMEGLGPAAFPFAQLVPPPGGTLPALDSTREATCP